MMYGRKAFRHMLCQRPEKLDSVKVCSNFWTTGYTRTEVINDNSDEEDSLILTLDSLFCDTEVNNFMYPPVSIGLTSERKDAFILSPLSDK